MFQALSFCKFHHAVRLVCKDDIRPHKNKTHARTCLQVPLHLCGLICSMSKLALRRNEAQHVQKWDVHMKNRVNPPLLK